MGRVRSFFLVLLFHSGSIDRVWDEVYAEDECQNDRWKRSEVQYDDRIVEVVWNAPLQTWKMLRFRDDKTEGNFRTVVTSILKSIKDGVEANEVSFFF